MTLPNKLRLGDLIACRKAGNPPEMLEIIKIYNDGRVLVRRENGVRAFAPIAIQTLRDYDYEIVNKNGREGK
ncbi:MAG: hypothetical protein PHW65_00150 [Dehalococcoidales bacterium]|nr:hypothetical protein [Dehalococcoidales bacterium]